MKRFVAGADRGQSTLLPECLDDFIGESNPVRVIGVFVDALDLAEMGFDGVDPAATGRPAYHPSVLLKLHIYGYLNRVQSSRRLEREAGRNVELKWLLSRLAPDHKTIADFRKDNRLALRKICARFIELCRDKLSKLKEEMGKLAGYEKQMRVSPDQQVSLTDPDDGHERPRLRRRGLQRAGCGRHRASSDRNARGDKQRLGSGTTCQHGQAGEEGCPEGRDDRGSRRPRLLQQPGDS
jgi:transposase